MRTRHWKRCVGIIGIHVDPDEAVSEIDALSPVIDSVVATGKAKAGVWVMGDLNADCSYVTKTEWKCIKDTTCSKTTMRSAFNVVDDAAVQFIALTATLVPGNLSGAADVVAVAAELREINGLTILVRISCCVFFYLCSICISSTTSLTQSMHSLASR